MILLLWISIWILPQSRRVKHLYDNFSIWYDIDQGWCIYQWCASWEVDKGMQFSLQSLYWIIGLFVIYKSRFEFCSTQVFIYFYQILIDYILRDWYNSWDTLGTIILWAWSIMLIWNMYRYLTYLDKLVLRLITSWMNYLILAGKIVQTLVEVQEHILYFNKLG